MKLWEADQARKDSANVSAFIDDVNQKYVFNIQSFSALYDWGFEKDEDFWNAVWDFSGIIGEKGERIKVADPQIFKGHFFTDGKLNFAENFIKRRDDASRLLGRWRRSTISKPIFAVIWHHVMCLLWFAKCRKSQKPRVAKWLSLRYVMWCMVEQFKIVRRLPIHTYWKSLKIGLNLFYEMRYL